MMEFIIGIICALTGIFLGWIIRWLYARFQLTSSEQKAKRIIQEAQKEAETRKREVLLETKDQLIKEKNQLEKETRERRNELQRMERRLIHKEENLERKIAHLEKQEKGLSNRERVLTEKETEIDKKQEKWRQELERLSGISSEEAKKLLIKSLENESFPFTKGAVPPEPFLSGLAEPLIAIGTAAVIIALFFSIRSK